MLLKQVLIGDEYMRVLKNLFGDNSKIHSDNIVVGTSGKNRSLSDSVIMESGSNANGKYIKFADGTLLQMGTKSVNSVVGVQIQETSLTLPTPFFDTNYQINMMQSYSHGNTTYSILVFGMTGNGKQTGTVGFYYGSPFGTWGVATSMNIDWIAIGRWK